MVKYGPRETLRTMARVLGDAEYRELLRKNGGFMYDSWRGMQDTATSSARRVNSVVRC